MVVALFFLPIFSMADQNTSHFRKPAGPMADGWHKNTGGIAPVSGQLDLSGMTLDFANQLIDHLWLSQGRGIAEAVQFIGCNFP